MHGVAYYYSMSRVAKIGPGYPLSLPDRVAGTRTSGANIELKKKQSRN